jgi:hypothetical protein
MYKNKIRIATEGGYQDIKSKKIKKWGENYTKGDDGLRVCPKCRLVWEHVVETGNVKAHDEYYPILPRYGKPEKVCPRCKRV